MLLCSILLNTAEDNQRLALAQITPAPEKFGGADDSSTNSSPDTEDGNDDDQNDGSIGSSGADGDDDADGMASQKVHLQAMNNKMKPQRNWLTSSRR
jgi:hypothetical protein